MTRGLLECPLQDGKEKKLEGEGGGDIILGGATSKKAGQRDDVKE